MKAFRLLFILLIATIYSLSAFADDGYTNFEASVYTRVSEVIKMKEFDKIIVKLKGLKPEIEKRYQITEIGVFGSYVRNEQTENSDIDILVSIDKNSELSLLGFCKVENWLSEVLGIKVDLVMKEGLKSGIGKRILSEVVYLWKTTV